ncbi:hypothetical protein PHYSODRAFT_304352 [Phytophthora sojae]|uniref:Uncharacterized protein n=1 Tax=Phytophthora sojae (strain P6497) TaxID=1094619 RepID=G5A0A6_PHYSP|nr:hypothetical protein PHYSODRAFT_304352 [Phytophthora sojae]EGZ10495.1 hypothetical protein PHYSODRAFT_304352 [Phytophthora sojae]|eukprot:XP_009533240.1 hypothetical protein PHYSODRAFT_304352 [Phytophthora sojae]
MCVFLRHNTTNRPDSPAIHSRTPDLVAVRVVVNPGAPNLVERGSGIALVSVAADAHVAPSFFSSDKPVIPFISGVPRVVRTQILVLKATKPFNNAGDSQPIAAGTATAAAATPNGTAPAAPIFCTTATVLPAATPPPPAIAAPDIIPAAADPAAIPAAVKPTA